MFVSIYYKPSLFNAHTMILIVHIFMNVNKLCLNQMQQQQQQMFLLEFSSLKDKSKVRGDFWHDFR